MATVTPRLYLIRHGETPFNKDPERTRGWADVPLTQHGIDEAQLTANRLKDVPFHTIVSSDLRRAKLTADIIAQYHDGVVPVATSDLRPWHLGEFTGVPVKDAMVGLAPYVEAPMVSVPEGESFAAFVSRFLKALQWLQYRASIGEVIAAVSHSRNLRVAMAYCQGGLQAVLSGKGVIGAGDDPVTPGKYLVLEHCNNAWKAQVA